MTGLECLKAELLEKGYNKAQANSQVLVGALEIISGAEGKYIDLAKLEKDIEEKEKKKKELEKWIDDANEIVRKLEFREGVIKDRLNQVAKDRYKEVKDYIDKFFKAIEECETPAGRDAIKIAQMYVNSVDVDTKYDNTAFIIGLASILSQGGIAPVEELHKINSKIPNITIDCNTYVTRDGREAVVDIVECKPGRMFGKTLEKV